MGGRERRRGARRGHRKLAQGRDRRSRSATRARGRRRDEIAQGASDIEAVEGATAARVGQAKGWGRTLTPQIQNSEFRILNSDEPAYKRYLAYSAYPLI